MIEGNIERMNERKDWENTWEERLVEWMRGKIDRMNERKDWENEWEESLIEGMEKDW